MNAKQLILKSQLLVQVEHDEYLAALEEHTLHPEDCSDEQLNEAFEAYINALEAYKRMLAEQHLPFLVLERAG